MNILHVINRFSFEAGGPARAVTDLAEAMTARGHGVGVASYTHDATPEHWNADKAPHTVKLPEPDLAAGFLSKPQARSLRSVVQRYDVVHLHGVWDPVLLQFARIAERVNRPWIVSVRGMLDDWCMSQRTLKKRFFLLFGGSRTLNRAARVHLTADAERDQAKKYFRRAESVVIPNLLNLEPFRRLPPADLARRSFDAFGHGEPVVLFLSRVHYKKGIEHLIRSVRSVLDAGRPHRVVIAGTGDHDYAAAMQKLAADEGVADRVSFVGQVTGELKLSLYRAADLFVLPTSQENFGFVFFEALASGLPLITTTGVDTWPALERSGGAEIVGLDPSGRADGSALIAKMTKMLSDADSLARRGEAGRAWVFEEMSADRLGDRFEELYQRAVSGGPGSGGPVSGGAVSEGGPP
ncbi:MAG: glycosyltransferase [Planctomycetota bacterium]